MSFWKPPQLPKSEKMPTTRPRKGPSYGARLLAGVAGVAFGLAVIVGLARSLQASSGGRSPFMALALLIPTIVLVRYALTGKIKV